jgi:alpha-N-arabinofuranosidase
MHIRCPNCHLPAELVGIAEREHWECRSCGSHFSLPGDQTPSYRGGHTRLVSRVERFSSSCKRNRFAVGSSFAAILLLASIASVSAAAKPAQRQEAAEGRLRNPGFESALDNWSVNIYGAKSEVVLDRQVKHAGNSSLRIASRALSDTALGQELKLTPGQNYQLTGWVKTKSLDPQGSPVCGTLQVQNAGGRGTIASGANHQGDNDWTQVSLFFQAPPSGRVRVAVFFVGFGKGTGTAWFDDLKLDTIDLADAPLKVTRKFLVDDTISPYQYGQFIEYLCDLVPSMWAEKLYDGSFEGQSSYKVAFIKEKDNREQPWYPSGATNRAEYTSDPQNPVNGQISRRIVVSDGPPSSVGISQDGVAVKAGQVCAFSCFLRQNGSEGPVTVRLHCEGRTLAGGELQVSDEWQKATLELRSTETTSAATLSIEVQGPATLWIDNASLMPDDAVGGWRPDVVEAVRALKPGVIRFGGSALDDSNLGEFEWRDTIGPADRRRPFRAWGGWQPTGAGLEEIVQFCRLVGAEPLICLRVTKKGPQDAAEQVQYFNGAVDTPQGRLRAENGHPEPYGIKFWQIGNERAGGEYESRLPEFCRAIKVVDPAIVLLSSYPTAGVLAGSSQWLDYVAPHHYSIANLSGAESDLQTIRRLIDKHAAGRKIKVAVTEWNTTAGDWGPHRAMLWTLDNALACARYHNLLHRHCDLVEIANRSNLINSFCSGIIQTDNHRLYKTPTYYAQQLYSHHAGNRPLAIESSGPVNLWPDVSATLSADGKKVMLFAVNQSPLDVTRPLDLRAFGDAPQTVAVWTLAGTQENTGPDAVNSFAEPERISPVESRFETGGGMFDYRFPKWSLTVLEWPVRHSTRGQE